MPDREPGAEIQGRKSWAGTEPSPEFPAGLTWFNVESPPTMASLRGKIVLLDFWTLGCINCQHIIPDLRRLEDEFADSLVVIGVHSGKYATEHDDRSIQEAARRYGIEHAVLNDEDFSVWRTFGVNAWPTLVLIDPVGNLVGFHSGEGVYRLFQPILASLASEFGERGALDLRPLPASGGARSTATVLSYPSTVVVDDTGRRLFVADAGYNRVVVTDFEGRVEQAIGSGMEGFADGPADEAAFRQPQGMALSEDENTLFVADTRNHAVRAVDLGSGDVKTIAGIGKQLDRLPVGPARATDVALASPWGVVVRGRSLYISMAGVHQIWEMDLERETISVFVGTSREGIQDGNRRTIATLAQPSGLAADDEYLYWVDPESSAVRRVPFAGDGDVETLVGTGLFDYGDEDGTGTRARLQHPQGIAFGGGTLYIADTYNHRIKSLDPATHAVTTLAGNGERGWSDGAGGEAMFDEPGGLSAAGGTLYVADTNNHLIRIVDAAMGATSTLRLSNLQILERGRSGAARREELPGVAVSARATTLRVVVESPAGHHLNRLAPSRLTLVASDPSVISIGQAGVSFSTHEGRSDARVAVKLAEGFATVTATGTIYFCREGEEALCFVKQVEVEIPVAVTGDGAEEILMTCKLGEDPSP